MDYAAYCKAYFAATGIHTSLASGGNAVYSSLAEAIAQPVQGEWEFFPLTHNPCFCGIPPDILYGLVHVEGTDNNVILGPVFGMPVNEESLSQLMQYLSLPPESRDALLSALSAAPAVTSAGLSRHLAFIHLSLNGIRVECDEIYRASDFSLPENTDMKARINAMENEEFHNSYYFEVEMYQRVREGDVERLNRFFRDKMHPHLSEGRMADSPLRHAKNVFIAAAARAGFIGAIPGGVNVEKAYQLMDYYIRECERLTSVEAVANLQYAMMTDFCRRAGEERRPDNLSTDVWHCMNYVRTHIYEPITLDDLARDVHRSASYVMKKFKAELGVHVSAYITKSKLEEACTMLIYTEKSLSEISSDLCFSSQSYFQNLFKKEYGITPAKYRKQERCI